MDTKKVHLIYTRENGRLHLTGYGEGQYIARANENHPVMFSVNCDEVKHAENNYTYENKVITIDRYNA